MQGYLYIGGAQALPTSVVNNGGSTPVINELNITPSTSAQTFNSSLVDGYKPINVAAVTNQIDVNITPENIKKDIQILSVTGTLESADELTATNTTGSAVSADDRVWVNGEDTYTRDFTTYNNPSIDDTTRIFESKAGNYGRIYKELSGIVPQSSYEQVVKIKYTSSLSSYTFVPVYSYDSRVSDPYGDGIRMITDGYPNNLNWKVPGRSSEFAASPSFSNLVVGNFYWFKIVINTEGVVASYSEDGINYTTITTISDTTLISNSAYSNINNKYFVLGAGGNESIIDLGGCYIKVDGQTIWTPYTTSTTYSIINDTDITSTSFTGIAQANIANNATGSVKTLLDGNGTYAPTTATKSITTNGTYTASAENAYGLSEVTVDVPESPIKEWYNWKNTEYTSNFTNTYTSGSGTAVLSNNNTTLTTSVTGYAYTQLPSRITSISSIETCIKFKPKTALSLLGGDFYFASILNNSNNDRGYGLTINTYDDHPGIGIAAGIGNTNAVTGAITFTVDSYIWLKVYMASSGSYLAYSTDGTNWTTKNITGTVSFSNVYGQYIAIGSIKTGMTGILEYDLSECYVKVNGETIWTPYSESSTSVFTDTLLPTTASTVYSAPFTSSALTITSVGTGTITCSDTKVYNRNSAGDEDSIMNITQNGTYDVTQYVSAVVDVPLPPTKKYNLLDRVKDDSNNEIGTVSGFFTDANNVEYAVVCLDAQYRLDSAAWCSNQSTIVTDLPTYAEAQWGPWEAKETATFNTQKILNFCTANSYTSTACSHCRSKSFTIDGTTYYGQLPNMIELNDIVRNHTALNAADITASSYPSVNFASSSNVWSSSQLSSGSAWVAYPGGSTNYYSKTTNRVAAPVLEIPNT